MSVQIRPRRARNRNRRKRPTITQQPQPSFAYATPVLTVTFNTPVRVNSLPLYKLSTGELPASVAVNSATEIALTYATGGVITGVTIPQNDPAVRSRTGGYATPGTFPVS